jgi:rhodanese-related sulfurtransferase
VVVYCQSGGRSAMATQLLQRAGYDALDIGGMSNW